MENASSHLEPPGRRMIVGSITHMSMSDRGAHVCTGSHGGNAVGRAAHVLGVRSLICHDAAVGLDDAGIQGLDYLDTFNVPAAAIGHMTARIGDPQDMLRRGDVSRVNKTAAVLGVIPGMACRNALALFQGAPTALRSDLDGSAAEVVFERHPLVLDSPATGRAVALDSASSIGAGDTGQIVVTGSHGGLPGGAAALAIKANAALAVFNDAGVGIDEAGISRLPVLDEMNVAGVCVDAFSARIGDGCSTYATGIVSVANSTARTLGARPGMPVRELVTMLAARAPS